MNKSSQPLPETKDAATLAAEGIDRWFDQEHADALHSSLAGILEKMADLCAAGKPFNAELLLAEHPDLNDNPEAAVRLVYEEFCLREETGQPADTAEFYGRFPQWHDALAVVFQCHHLLHDDNESPKIPSAGESLGELRLIREIGRGALGRVFLASQPSLSDRQLAVKITARRGQEHLSLARLQHTNIVPLYLVQDFPDAGLRALCMPYLGGVTWARVLKRFGESVLVKRTGRQIVECVTEEHDKSPGAATAFSPAIGFLARETYVDAVCWIGACLADALSYAHQRGLVHLDIKPSNVLLASDGQPMLLDFHLASEIDHLQSNFINRLGGTPGYMSPEQSAAADAIRKGTEIKQRLDGRSDIYSLGVLLYESLAGQLPAADFDTARDNLRKANAEVSQGLEDIVCKCLSLQPKNRYDDAAQLAADLRCHLARLPLRGVANRSLVERWRKWRLRKPHALPFIVVGLFAALIILAIGGLFYRDRLRSAEAYLAQSQRELSRNEYDVSIEHASNALSSLRWFPWEADLRGHLSEQIEVAQHAQAVANLHDFVEQLRFLDTQQLSTAKLAEIAAGCGKVWQARDRFLPAADPKHSPEGESNLSESLRRDLLDLAILSARLDLQIAQSAQDSDGSKVTAARRQALEKLDQAQEICGASALLDLVRRDYANDAQSNPSSTELKTAAAGKAWEHYAIGRWLMHHGKFAEAKQQLSAAIELQPDEFWANFQLTCCEFELGDFQRALVYASVCIALAPSQPECFYNRAICNQSLGRDEDALADFTRALHLDPGLAPASMARGALLGHMKRYDESKADLNAALAHGSRPADVYYQLARLSLAQNDRAAASDWVKKSLAADPNNDGAAALEKELAAGK